MVNEEEKADEDQNFDNKSRAYIDVLLNQYNDLRAEITQCIYLEHAAILGLYTFLGISVAVLIREGITGELSLLTLSCELNSDRMILSVFALIIGQIIINGFGSLFLKEQARNRRACSFQKAVEHLINKEIGRIGIYWENYITSYLIAIKDMKKIEYFKFNIQINPQYYKNRLLGIGLPVFLPNLLITLLIGSIAWVSYGRDILILLILGLIFIFAVMPFFILEFRFYLLSFLLLSATGIMFHAISGEGSLIFIMFFVISFAITMFWALMIMLKVFSPLKSEGIPDVKDVLDWLTKEEHELKEDMIFRSIF